MTVFSGRVILVGAANVGKTALVERYVQGYFSKDTKPTLGCECRTRVVLVDKQTSQTGSDSVQLSIYDTAGQERYAEISASYFRHADVCLLCFDLGNIASFDHIKWWRKKVEEHNQNISYILVGTKQDLLKNVPGETEYARRFASDNTMPFFCTSALSGGDQVEFLFYCVAEKILRLRIQEKAFFGRKQSTGEDGKSTGVIRLNSADELNNSQRTGILSRCCSFS